MLQGKMGQEMAEEVGLVLQAKVKRLAAFVRASKYAVAYTGAGISTAAGVPDFRGPSGVWTLQAKGETVAEPDFTALNPTLTHELLRILIEKGHFHHIVTQNIDSLHLRSGVPSEKQTELHGNYCLEICPICDARYFRSCAVWEGLTTPSTVIPLTGVDNDHRTGRLCEAENCSGELENSVVLFGESMPAKEVAKAWEHTSRADLALVLGSSLKVAPARDMPGQVAKTGGCLIIVNLQRTHFDGQASLVIYARCDEVMRLLAEELHFDFQNQVFQKERINLLLRVQLLKSENSIYEDIVFKYLDQNYGELGRSSVF